MTNGNGSSKLNWRNALRLLAVCSLSLIVSNCGSLPGKEPLERNLPPAPEFAKPVAVPEPRAGEDQLAIAARERTGRKQNGMTIKRFLDWYFQVRAEYGAK